ncbi:hypothetical protein DPMN_041740 [Dreissena polymorpha]|uniref:Uncharacterized protein n=1 Tax=Dreissena polymorpha TaxID=45954 RepID=A0A9D4CZM0_DREPO|nr:hypothetical protein DPMN_041740 [Dreissena polymorpha]
MRQELGLNLGHLGKKAFAPYVTGSGLEALPEHSSCMLWSPGSNPGLSTYHLSEQTLIQVQVFASDPKNAGFIAYKASAQTGAITRTPMAYEASSHSGTRNEELIELRSEQSPFTRRVPGSNPKSMDHYFMKPALRDSKPGSDAHVASAQTGDGTLNPVAYKASAQTGVQSRDP